MSAPKFTPGPWRIFDNSSKRPVLCSSAGGRLTYIDSDLTESNRSLIAAAPDMYAALVNVGDELRLLLLNPKDDGTQHERIARALRIVTFVIGKARGEA